VEISEFKKHYPHGFLVPRVQNIFDNTLISTIRNALRECKKLGVAFTTDNILVKKIKANIRIIRKRSYDYHQEKIIIGRSGTSDIVFDHDDVSRNHAYIYCDIMNNKVYLIDNDSSNGTFINGEKITPRQPSILSDNDEIAFGRKARVIYLSPVGFYNLLHTMAATNEEAAGSSGVPVEESVR
jgi:pSer/pThr/pTyr-binding forkhead associated (FHA) protein